MGGPNDTRQHSLPSRQWSLPVCAAGLLIIIVLGSDVAVEIFVLVDRAADASGLLNLSGELERDLEPRRPGGCRLRGRWRDGGG